MKSRKHSKRNRSSSSKSNREGNHLSPDGKWEKMKLRGLLRYVPSGIFHGRCRYKGKLLRGSLETDDYATAAKRLPIYIEAWKKEFDDQQAQNKQKCTEPTTWHEAAGIYTDRLMARAQIGDIQFGSAELEDAAVRKIAFFWPSIEERPVREIDEDEFLKFLAEARSGTERFVTRQRIKGKAHSKGEFRGGKQGDISYNLMLKVAKRIVKIAQKCDYKKNLAPFEDPLENISRVSDERKIPTMPTDEEWSDILDALEKVGCGRYNPKLPRLFAEFMANTGARLCELIGRTRHCHKNDAPHPGFRWIDIRSGKHVITCAKKRKNRKWMKRYVPWIDGTGELMDRIRNELYKGDDNELVFKGMRIDGLDVLLPKAIRLCRLEQKLKHFTQHSIRHLFATKCAENAEIPWKAIAEWLGHDDGGTLAAKLYSHLREGSSEALAAKVSYRKKAKQ